MSAILVLLTLLSVATLASRRGYAAFIAHIVTTPILLAVGIALSPRALGLFTESTSEALLPAMRVGAAWLALLVGMRAHRPRANAHWFKLTLVALVSSLVLWAALAAAAWGTMLALVEWELGFSESGGSRLSVLGAALLVGGLVVGTGLSFTREALEGYQGEPATKTFLFISRHDDIIAAVAMLAAIWVWPPAVSIAPIYAEPGIAVGVVLGIGFTLSAAQLLSGDNARGSQQNLIAVLGLLVFASGLSTTAMLPGAAIAFFFGVFLAFSGRGPLLLRALCKTERPVRLVVLILVGAHVGLSPAAVAVGVALAVARFVGKWILASLLTPTKQRMIPLAGIVGSSGLSIPFALSFALSRSESLAASEILTAICVCVSLSDLVTLVFWRNKTKDTDDASIGTGLLDEQQSVEHSSSGSIA